MAVLIIEAIIGVVIEVRINLYLRIKVMGNRMLLLIIRRMDVQQFRRNNLLII